MKIIKFAVMLFGVFIACYGQSFGQQTEPQLALPDTVPSVGTFWSLRDATSGQLTAPLPYNPYYGTSSNVPMYSLGDGRYLMDDVPTSDTGPHRATTGLSTTTTGLTDLFNMLDTPAVLSFDSFPANERNSQKFAAQIFSVINTNAVAGSDTNLYKAIISFPSSTNTSSFLQIMGYGTNSVIIKANHFNYSGQTGDFALLICDTIDKPVWKNIDLGGASDSQDGWLVQVCRLS